MPPSKSPTGWQAGRFSLLIYAERYVNTATKFWYQSTNTRRQTKETKKRNHRTRGTTDAKSGPTTWENEITAHAERPKPTLSEKKPPHSRNAQHQTRPNNPGKRSHRHAERPKPTSNAGQPDIKRPNYNEGLGPSREHSLVLTGGPPPRPQIQVEKGFFFDTLFSKTPCRNIRNIKHIKILHPQMHHHIPSVAMCRG